jgi:hypothetical protein
MLLDAKDAAVAVDTGTVLFLLFDRFGSSIRRRRPSTATRSVSVNR